MAVSDAGRKLATPREVVPTGELADYLAALVRSEGVAVVVVGVPKTMRGEVGFQARRILGTLSNLKGRIPEAEFVEWDERLTTRIAAPPEEGGGKRRKKRGASRDRVDHLAAARMLQEYLKFRESV